MRPLDARHARRASAWRVLAIVLACLGPLPTPAETAAPSLEAYTARYQVSYRGLAGGYVESSLKPGSAPGIWLYATRALSEFSRTHGGERRGARARHDADHAERVRPLEFEFNDGTAEEAKDVRSSSTGMPTR